MLPNKPSETTLSHASSDKNLRDESVCEVALPSVLSRAAMFNEKFKKCTKFCGFLRLLVQRAVWSLLYWRRDSSGNTSITTGSRSRRETHTFSMATTITRTIFQLTPIDPKVFYDSMHFSLFGDSRNHTTILDGRTFVTIEAGPGVPATLNTVSKKVGASGPLLCPYPDWSWHVKNDCNVITSVYHIAVCTL